MPTMKPEVETGSGNKLFERKQMSKRLQRLAHIFDHARPECDTADIDRHREPQSEINISVGYWHILSSDVGLLLAAPYLSRAWSKM